MLTECVKEKKESWLSLMTWDMDPGVLHPKFHVSFEYFSFMIWKLLSDKIVYLVLKDFSTLKHSACEL